jgi:hypothetical protein
MIFNLILQGFFSLFELFFSLLPSLPDLPDFQTALNSVSDSLRIIFGTIDIFGYILGSKFLFQVLFGILLIAYPAMYIIRFTYFVLSKSRIIGGK